MTIPSLRPLALLLWVLLFVPNPGGAPAVAAESGSPSDAIRISVLVHLEPGADRGPVRRFASAQGGRVAHEYRILPRVMNLRGLPAGSIDQLGRVPGVLSVERDPQVGLHLNQSTGLIGAMQSQIQAAGFTADGSGVRVCVVDTGVRADHIMYVRRIDMDAGYDFVHDDPDPDDEHGHGSHVMGIAIGGTDVVADFGDPACSAEPLQGVAPVATGIAQKVIDASGSGSGSDIIAAIDRCADPALAGGPADVINLSIGGGSFRNPCDSDAMAAAANAAVDAGLVVVASSGNDAAANALASPACGSKVISVGATYDADYPTCDFALDSFTFCLDAFCFQTCTDDFPTTDQIACFSNQSAHLDVAAPGCVTWSAEPSEINTITANCGTSMSAPHVSGLAALILSQNSGLTPVEVRQAIRDGAVDRGPAGYDKAFGYGRIDALGSLAVAGSGCSTAADCDDGNLCTTDTCSGGSCSHDPVACSDGNACTLDQCDPALGCSHQTVSCNDGDACTSDSCNFSTGVCANDPIPGCGTCLAAGATCSTGAECCSGKCRGKAGAKRCR